MDPIFKFNLLITIESTSQPDDGNTTASTCPDEPVAKKARLVQKSRIGKKADMWCVMVQNFNYSDISLTVTNEHYTIQYRFLCKKRIAFVQRYTSD
jgi:hypothetical protein